MKKICIITTISLTMKTFMEAIAKHLADIGEYEVTLICNHDNQFADNLAPGLRYIPVAMARVTIRWNFLTARAKVWACI